MLKRVRSLLNLCLSFLLSTTSSELIDLEPGGSLLRPEARQIVMCMLHQILDRGLRDIIREGTLLTR